MKPDLLTNATVVDDAIRIVSDYNNNRRLLSKKEGNKGSKEPGCNEDEDQLEEKEKRQEN